MIQSRWFALIYFSTRKLKDCNSLIYKRKQQRKSFLIQASTATYRPDHDEHIPIRFQVSRWQSQRLYHFYATPQNTDSWLALSLLMNSSNSKGLQICSLEPEVNTQIQASVQHMKDSRWHNHAVWLDFWSYDWYPSILARADHKVSESSTQHQRPQKKLDWEAIESLMCGLAARFLGP